MSRVRCAVYTRKSSEEGLEQDFNSLDAQFEGCAAYIESQASEGWVLSGSATTMAAYRAELLSVLPSNRFCRTLLPVGSKFLLRSSICRDFTEFDSGSFWEFAPPLQHVGHSEDGTMMTVSTYVRRRLGDLSPGARQFCQGRLLPLWSRMAIAELAARGATYSELMTIFGVSRSTIYRAIHRTTASYCMLSGQRLLTATQTLPPMQ